MHNNNRRHYPPQQNSEQRQPDTILAEEEMDAGHKKLQITLRENSRGRYLMIRENVRGQFRNIGIPAQFLGDVSAVIARLADFERQLQETSPQAEA